MDPIAFGVQAAERVGGRGQFGDKSLEFLVWFDVRTVFALVTFGARKPNHVTAGVHKEREGLGRSTEAEVYGVASVTLREDGSGGGRGSVGIFEVAGSC